MWKQEEMIRPLLLLMGWFGEKDRVEGWWSLKPIFRSVVEGSKSLERF